ncbi:MAG: anti-sigma factor family protein [Anaerolineae bacterium]
MLRLRGRKKSEQERRDELLSAYLDGELGEGERQRLEARLARDVPLRAELRALQQTVSLMRELPEVAAPRNFILSESMVEQRQPALKPEPRARRTWAAPLLTAATAVVSLLFVVVLAGDLLLPGIGGLASAPEPMEQAQEIPEIALQAAPTADDAEIERESAPSGTPAPMPAAKALGEEPDTAVEEAAEAPREEPEIPVAEEAAEEIPADEDPLGTGTPSALTAAGGGGPTEEAVAGLAAPTAEPMLAPTVVSGAALTSTIPAEAPAVAEEPAGEELGLLEPTPGQIDVTPLATQIEERGVSGPRRRDLPWELLEIGLGLTAVVLIFTTIQAWRVRRR